MNHDQDRSPRAAPTRVAVRTAKPALAARHSAAVANTYLLGVGEIGDPAALVSLRVGARLKLRRARAIAGRGRPRVEVRSADDRPLGYLPPEDVQSIEDLLDVSSARVTGLVPAFQRPRVMLEIQVGAEADGR